MITPEAELTTILNSEPPATDSANMSSLEQIDATKQQLSQVKECISDIIDSMAHEKSMIAKAADYWGNMHPLEKVAYGVVLTGPTLAAGAIAHVGILLAISGVTLVSYTASGILLDDHHRYNVNVAERLKKGILSLAEVLEFTIAALDRVKVKFEEEINKFREQNLELAENVKQLTEQMQGLGDQIEYLTAIETMYRKNKDDLERITAELKNSDVQNAENIKKSQEQLEKARLEYEVSQTQLAEKIIELDKVRTTLSSEVAKAKEVSSTLLVTTNSLAEAVIEDKSKRESLLSRLNNLVSNTETNVRQFTEKLNQSGQDLAQTTQVFTEFTTKFGELLDKQEQQVVRFEKINDQIVKEQSQPNAKLGQLLNANGFYGIKKIDSMGTEPLMKTIRTI